MLEAEEVVMEGAEVVGVEAAKVVNETMPLEELPISFIASTLNVYAVPAARPVKL